jgi:hypothetical protein
VAKRPLNQTELEKHLDEQLGFLESSAASFDTGYEGEAKRLAVTLRVLLHDTKKSHSLLGQLGRKNATFFDSAFEFNPANLASHGGLVFVAVGPPRTRYVAMLDDVPVSRFSPFDKWWAAQVFVDQERRILTREDLVLIAANQDGGAHIDPGLDETYDKLSRENALGWVAVENGAARPMDGPERAAIRQIAHEVLKTLKPGYTKVPSHPTGVLVGGMSMVHGAPRSETPAAVRPMQATERKIRRNEPCPCGSGRKYKHCHGRTARTLVSTGASVPERLIQLSAEASEAYTPQSRQNSRKRIGDSSM